MRGAEERSAGLSLTLNSSPCPSPKKKAPAERPQVSVPLDCWHLPLQHNWYVHHPIKLNLWHFRFLHGLNGGNLALHHNWHIKDLSHVLHLWNLDLPNCLMRHTVARVNHDARRPLRSAQRQTSSDRHVHDGNVKLLEHELRHALLAGQGHVHGGHVERREREGARGSRGILRRVPGTHTPLRAGGCPTAHLLCVPFLAFFWRQARREHWKPTQRRARSLSRTVEREHR